MWTSIFSELSRCVMLLPKKLTKTSARRHRPAFLPLRTLALNFNTSIHQFQVETVLGASEERPL